jgi:ribosomal protein S6
MMYDAAKAYLGKLHGVGDDKHPKLHTIRDYKKAKDSSDPKAVAKAREAQREAAEEMIHELFWKTAETKWGKETAEMMRKLHKKDPSYVRGQVEMLLAQTGQRAGYDSLRQAVMDSTDLLSDIHNNESLVGLTFGAVASEYATARQAKSAEYTFKLNNDAYKDEVKKIANTQLKELSKGMDRKNKDHYWQFNDLAEHETVVSELQKLANRDTYKLNKRAKHYDKIGPKAS